VRPDQSFKGRQFTAEVILWAVRWYLMFPISYRDLELMLADRGVDVAHTTLFRWNQTYALEIEKRIRPHLRPSNGSWRVDETYARVKGRWMYLYRAVDSRGQTIDFLLSAKRDAEAAKRFFRKALGQPHTISLTSSVTWIAERRMPQCCSWPGLAGSCRSAYGCQIAKSGHAAGSRMVTRGDRSGPGPWYRRAADHSELPLNQQSLWGACEAVLADLRPNSSAPADAS
jgi:hypothetical protein